MFKHPNYYKNLRKLARNRKLQEIVDGIAASDTDQVISRRDSTEAGRRSPGPGLKHQASSTKLREQQATSVKPRGTSVKLQAASIKLQDS